MTSLTVRSPAFDEGSPVPDDFTCRGAGRVPALGWTGVPESARSLALVVDDPDAPRGTFVHWILLGLATDVTGIADGAPDGAVEAATSAGRPGWYPPCPPGGTHRYRFTVHALDATPGEAAAFAAGADTPAPVVDRIARRAIASGTLTGTVTAAR